MAPHCLLVTLHLLSQVPRPQEESCSCLFPGWLWGFTPASPPRPGSCRHCNDLQRSGSSSVEFPDPVCPLLLKAPRAHAPWTTGPAGPSSHTPCPGQLLGGDSGSSHRGGDPARHKRNTVPETTRKEIDGCTCLFLLGPWPRVIRHIALFWFH